MRVKTGLQSCFLVLLLVFGTTWSSNANASPSQQPARKLLEGTAGQHHAPLRKLLGVDTSSNNVLILASSQEVAMKIQEAAASGAPVKAVMGAGTTGNELTRLAGDKSANIKEFNTLSLAPKPEKKTGLLRRP